MTQRLLDQNLLWDIELFSSDSEMEKFSKLKIESKIPIFHYHRFWQRMSVNPFDLCVYHLEDDPTASFVERAMQLWPGVCFLHSRSLSHLMLSRFGHSTAGSDIDNFVHQACGENSPPMGKWKILGWDSEVFYKFLTLDKDLIKKAFHLVVPTQHLVNREARVKATMLPLRLLHFHSDIEENFNPGIQILGFSGIDLVSDRIHTILDSLRHVFIDHQSAKGLWLVNSEMDRAKAQQIIINDFVSLSTKIDICVVEEATLLTEKIKSCAIWIGTSFSEHRALAVPSIIALAVGVPAIGSTSSEWDEFPEDSYLPISLGRNEGRELESILSQLLASNELLRNIKINNRAIKYCETSYFSLLENLFSELIGSYKNLVEQKSDDYRRAVAELQSMTELAMNSSYGDMRKAVVKNICELDSDERR